MKPKYFRDPVHNFIVITRDYILELIDTEEFQRLRQIKQLGTSEITYYGANHNRFSHSIGTMYLMEKALSQLKSIGVSIDEETEMTALTAALLHDIGHGPFSHIFEKVIGSDHEKWTINIILGDTEINQVLQDKDKSLPQKIASVISKEYERKYIVYLLSSQLDVDRMDYLLRDSYYVGVKYGLFDPDMIFKSMQIHGESIAIDYKGLYAVEQYIHARYYMYWQVYYHKTTRGYELLLENILKRAKYLYEQNRLDKGIDTLIPVFRKGNEMDIKDYIKLNDNIILYAISLWRDSEDKVLRDLCNRYLRRDLYKAYELKEDNIHHIGKIENKLKEKLIQYGFEEENVEYYFGIDRPSNVTYDYYVEGEEGEKPVILIHKEGKYNSITRFSDSIKSLAGIKKYRYCLYFTRANYEGEDITDELIKIIKEGEEGQ
ncbi:MAG: HD domain-containing protein [Thermoanaerobacter sp.]|nr:HD domain-containing protein [Thermoanaerobacter sp.]